MFTEMMSTGLLTLMLGAHSLGQGRKKCSTSNAAKREEKASHMFTGRTAFLKLVL